MESATEFSGMYISADNKTKINVKGNENQFKQLIGGNCDIFPIRNDYQIIYDKKSKEINKFLLPYILYSAIQGPIIIYNTKNLLVSLENIRITFKQNRQR